MLVERTSKVEHEYGGKKFKAGDKVEVEPQHVIVLLALGKIVPEEGEIGYTPSSGISSHDQVPARSRRNGSQRK